jgi:hypothetical protein
MNTGGRLSVGKSPVCTGPYLNQHNLQIRRVICRSSDHPMASRRCRKVRWSRTEPFLAACTLVLLKCGQLELPVTNLGIRAAREWNDHFKNCANATDAPVSERRTVQARKTRRGLTKATDNSPSDTPEFMVARGMNYKKP